MNKFNYIRITPAKDEEKYIEKTIQSVISQTVLPVRWIIVDDGSTDRTPEVVMKYINDYPFIRLVQREKVKAINIAIRNFTIILWYILYKSIFTNTNE